MRTRRWFDSGRKPDEPASAWSARLALFDTPDVLPPYQPMIVAAIALDDTARAIALFDALNDSLNGYEASVTLLEELLSPAADLISPQTHVEWLENTRLLVKRFCPTYDLGPTDERLARRRA